MKVAVIGVGYWGPNLVRNLIALQQDVIVFDRQPERSESIVGLYPTRCSKAASLECILKNSSINVVVIAVPVHSHCDLIVQALNAGKHIFVEKPLCQTIEEVEIIAKARNHSSLLMTGHITSYSPGIQALKAAIDDGVIGIMQSLSLCRTHCGPIYSETDVLTEVAAHDAAIALLIQRELPCSVIACGYSRLNSKEKDAAHLILEWKNGFQTYIDVQWTCALRRRTIFAEGSGGSLLFSITNGAEQLELYEQEQVFATIKSGASQLEVARRTPPIKSIPIVPCEPLFEELKELLRCIYESREPITGFDFSQKVVKVLHAARISLNAGNQRVDIV